VRALVDKALDWLLDKLQAMVNKILSMLGLGKGPVEGSLSPEEIKERVAEEIAPRMAQGFPTIDEARAYLDTVMQRYRPAGLKALTLHPKDDKGTSFDVLATASPETDVGDLVISLNVIPPKAGDIKYGGLDGHGRATKAWGWLSPNAADRDSEAQSRVSGRVNEVLSRQGISASFDAGHLIAARLGGAGDERNLVPQERGSNRSWWKSFENFIRKELDDHPGEFVYADVAPDYTSDPFLRLITDDEVRALPEQAVIELWEPLLTIPDAIRVLQLGRRAADGKDVSLGAPAAFGVREQLQSLRRSLKGIVDKPVSRGREVYER
jgi:hypothetical protein